MTDPAFDPDKTVVAICGGVGGAKLALGLQHELGDRLTVVVNVADDFEHMGLRICPDLDTVIYTLGGLSDEVRGWGRAGESWNFMEATRQLGGESWFMLGDRDLALHVERTRRLASGETLTEIIADIARTLGIAPHVLPVTDDDIRTKVETDIGILDFQRYFVEHRCAPTLRRISFEGARHARLNPRVTAALASPDLGAIVICPSNPYLSIDPILAVPGLRDAMSGHAPVVAVSPIIGGHAIKGPTAKIMRELNIDTTQASIARHYAGLIDGLLIDAGDAADLSGGDIRVHAVPTLMTDLASRIALARETLAFAAQLTR
ncbi:MAG: cofD [Tardiphaga sp.]|jgi:LPPG:FO 2-phospho-L-lactate transferase|nr:cofD [Tardiphaga sp.]